MSKQYQQVDVASPRCPTCGSSQRSKYQATRRLAISGMTSDGIEYTSIVWKRTTCRVCNQQMIHRFFENEIAEETDPKK